jgi:hypothetical protein
MLALTAQQISEYLQASYTAVDGLWFMKVEEVLGFERALEIDERVWQVMPKIQARRMKAFANVDRGIEALRECFTAKLNLDGFEYEIHSADGSFDVHISRCPWYDKLVKSKRVHLAERIANRICMAEYSGWAQEFDCAFAFSGKGMMCSGCVNCGLHFNSLPL